MQEAILTVLTIVASFGLLVVTIILTGAAWEERKNGEDTRAGGLISLSMIPIALALTCLSMSSVLRVVFAYYTSGKWDSHYVLHFPTASDFWVNFVPNLWSSRAPLMEAFPNFAFWLYVTAAVAVALGLWLIRRATRQRYAAAYLKAQGFRKMMRRGALHVAVYTAFFHVVMFLLAYLLASVVFLSGYWGLLVVFAFLAAAGGGATYIYDSNGNKIGKITRY